MNRSSLSVLMGMTACAAFFASEARLNSQEIAAPVPKTPQELLTALKASNAELLQKQQKTLQKIDELKQQADQLRIMSKRG